MRRLGPHRRRQVDAARRGDRPGAALHRRPAVRRRAAGRREHRAHAAAGARPPDRLRRPGPARRLRHRHRRGGARLRHGAARAARADDAPPGRGDPRPAGHRRAARPRPAHPVRRPAAAGRDRLGPDHAPAAAGARRADLRAGPDRRRGRAGHPDPPGPRRRALGAARRAPAGAGGAVRGPDRAAHRRGRAAGRGAGHVLPHSPVVPPIVELGRAAGLGAAAADRPRRPPPGPRARPCRRCPPPVGARRPPSRADRRGRDGHARPRASRCATPT